MKTGPDFKTICVAYRKVIIIGPAYPLRGGLATYNERLAREFQDDGDDVTIITFSLQYPGFLFPGTTQYSDGPAPAGIKIHSWINSINPLSWISTGNRISRMKPDLIIVRYWLPFMGPALGTILRKAKKNKHSRIVCIADNIIPHEKRIGDEAFTRYFVKPVDAFITMSEKVLNQLKQYAPGKPSRFVPHPLYDNFGNAVSKYEARESLELPQDFTLLLFFGFIRKYKGLDLLLDAVAILKSRGTFNHTKLVIAGEFYEDSKPYLEQITGKNLRDDVILRTNFIPDDEVRNYFCAADVVIQPYRNATQSGVTPLAYHYNVPMVVTNVGGLPAMVPDGVVGLVSEPTAESLADKIEQFLNEGAEKFKPGIALEKLKYSWANMRKDG